ncbi:MAG: sirohydrochlorin chelatase [Gammaproteobacteria bacterium]
MLGVIVFAHGSRDPQWRLPVEAVAREVQAQAPQARVGCAYLELTGPDLPSCARTLVEQGADVVRVLPLFFGMGKHAREDLPVLMQQLSAQHPHVRFDCLPAAGEHASLTRLLAAIAIGKAS